MHILFPVVTAAILVFLGYAALWSSYQNTIPKGIAQFGKVLAIVLFVIAGLSIFFGAIQPGPRPPMGGKAPCAAMQPTQGQPCPMKDRQGPDAMMERGQVPQQGNPRQQQQAPAPQMNQGAPVRK